MSEDNSQVEKEFREACAKAHPLIDEQIDIARAAIAKAEKIAEEYGVPFSSDITPLGMSYTPASLDERVRELNDDDEGGMFVYGIANCGLNEYEGWEHSAVC